MTNKQARFIEEYLVDLNATQAAIRAGYSPNTANEQGAQLLAKLSIKDAIDKAMAERSARTGINQDRVVRELARIAFVKITDVANSDGTIKQDASDDDLACIESLKVKTSDSDTGYMAEREVKLASKMKALELLGKHLGMWNDKLNIEGVLPVVISGGEALED